jgi:hypothetical protein
MLGSGSAAVPSLHAYTPSHFFALFSASAAFLRAVFLEAFSACVGGAIKRVLRGLIYRHQGPSASHQLATNHHQGPPSASHQSSSGAISYSRQTGNHKGITLAVRTSDRLSSNEPPRIASAKILGLPARMSLT